MRVAGKSVIDDRGSWQIVQQALDPIIAQDPVDFSHVERPISKGYPIGRVEPFGNMDHLGWSTPTFPSKESVPNALVACSDEDRSTRTETHRSGSVHIVRVESDPNPRRKLDLLQMNSRSEKLRSEHARTAEQTAKSNVQ